MIFINGADNPDNIAFNDRPLEYVYFNGTLVWQKEHAQSTDLYGDFTIPESNASDFGINTGDGGGGGGGGGGESTTNPYQEVVGGTAKVFRRSGRNDYYNDLDFVSYVLFRTLTTSGVETSVGAQYRALLSTELAWPREHSLGVGIGMQDIGISLFSMSSFTNWNEETTGESGFPSCAEFYESHAVSSISVTLAAELVGDGIYDPSRWVQRSYSAKLHTLRDGKYITITPWGDEYGIYTVTTGYVFQGSVDLYVKQV